METKVLEKRKEWVAALKSGNYKQCEGSLRIEDSYCCLGVLCDVVDKTKWGGKKKNGLLEYPYDGDHCALPPKEVLDEVDITEEYASKLSDLNDCDISFERIAEVIEKDLIN